jgi:hypothetical protein
MKGMNRRSPLLFPCAAALICTALSAQVDRPAGPVRFYAAAVASTLVEQGLMSPAPTGAEAAAFEPVPAPAIRNVPNDAQATSSPWIDSNAWRFHRGIHKANYARLPPGSAGLAAAEAFTFGVDAILNPDPGDVLELGKILRFLKNQEQPRMAAMANIGIVDDGSPAMGEVLNMLTRRNLLYRVVSGPDRALDLTVQVGTPDFPKDAVSNPSEFAARVRAKLGDDRRLVRLYGTSTAIAHFTGDGKRARLYLLSYSRNRNQADVRVRVLGRYQPANVAVYGAPPDAKLMDIQNPGKTTEFSIPAFNTIAIIDLTPVK